MKEEALVHLLKSHVGQSVEVDQHFIGFLKAIEPFYKRIQQSNNYFHKPDCEEQTDGGTPFCFEQSGATEKPHPAI